MNKSWSAEEQNVLGMLQTEYACNWKKIATQMENRFPNKIRTAKQCRERFINFARFDFHPQVQEWTKTQSQMLLDYIVEMGFQWEKLSFHFKNRSGNFLKNKFNNSMNKLIRKINAVLRKQKQQSIIFNSVKRLFSLSELVPKAREEDKLESQNIKIQLLERALVMDEEQLDHEWIKCYRSRLHALNKRYKCIFFKKIVGTLPVPLLSEKSQAKEPLSSNQFSQRVKKIESSQNQTFQIDSLLNLEDLIVLEGEEQIPELKQFTKQSLSSRCDQLMIEDQFQYFEYFEY